MSEYNPFTFTLQEELSQIDENRRLAKKANQKYRAIQDIRDYSLDDLKCIESQMAHYRRSSYLIDTASCAVDIALHPEAKYPQGYEERDTYLKIATEYWKTVSHWEFDKPNDLSELAKWNLCQLPTYRAIAQFMEDPNHPIDIYSEQEAEFKKYFAYVLDHWGKETLDGHVLESLTSYFAHRSNKLRPNEPPILTTASPVRDDHHTQAERRVDVDMYLLPSATKFGIQVKSGRIKDPYANRPVRHRIFFNNARRALCIPTTDKSLKRTIQAIISDAPEHRDALDTIAADHRARLYREIQEDRLVGSRFLGKVALQGTSSIASENPV